MNRNEQQMYSDITSIRKSLEKIANALNTPNVVYNGELKNTKDIPGFEGTLDALDNLCNVSTKDEEYDFDVHNDYLNDLVQGMNQIEYLNFHNEMSFSFASNDSTAMSDAIYELEYEECLGAIQRALLITGDSDYIEAVECSNLGLGYNKETKDELARKYVEELLENKDKDFEAYHANLGKLNNNPPLHKDDPYTYDNDLNEYCDGIKNDSDHDIRLTAKFYEDEYLKKEGATKKECILDYVTNEFGSHGARYSDITKFCYYLGAHNTPVKHNATRDRGYYSLALSHSSYKTGHLVTGGTNQLVKGINKEGKERYFALSFVESATDYWKRLDE